MPIRFRKQDKIEVLESMAKMAVEGANSYGMWVDEDHFASLISDIKRDIEDADLLRDERQVTEVEYYSAMASVPADEAAPTGNLEDSDEPTH